MAAMQAKKVDESDDVNEDDDFAVGSDDEGTGAKIAMPVAQFQSKFVGEKDEQSGKSISKGGILDLSEKELQDLISDPRTKEELIRKLLEMAPQGKSTHKSPVPAKAPEEKYLQDYEGKDDPSNPENEADFKKAYAKLLGKLVGQKTEEPQMLVTDEDIKKLERDRQKVEDARTFNDRAQKLADSSKKKKDLVKEERAERELKECTFAPKTLRASEKRTLEDFLKDQQRHLDRKQENINKMAKDNQEKEESSIVSMPKINERSKVLKETKDKDKGGETQPAYERLFAISKKPLAQAETAKEEEEKEKKKPKKVRDPERELALYEEAKKRQERWLERQKKETEGAQKPKVRNYAGDTFVQQKFVKEYNNAVANLGLQVEDKVLLTYEQMKDLLCKMSFIKQSTAGGKEEETKELLQKIWQTLEGDKRAGVSVETLRSFLGSVMKIMFAPDAAPGAPSTTGRYGTFAEDGKYTVTQTAATKIHQDFVLLYLNRKAYNAPSAAKSKEDDEYSFKPSLCEHSVTLANSAREKHAGKDQPTEHVEMLNQAKKDQEAKLRKKKEEAEEAQKAECTFKPHITEYKPEEDVKASTAGHKHVKVSTSKSTADRCHVLYQLSKKIVKKDDKSTDEYFFEKEKDQYTFSPNIDKEKIEETGHMDEPMVPETIERLKKAREEHERVKRGTERAVDESGMRFALESNKFKKGSGESKLLSASHVSTQSKGSGKKEAKKPETVESKPEEKVAIVDNVPVEAVKSQSEVQAPVPVAVPQESLPGPTTGTEIVPTPEAAAAVPKDEEKLYIDVNLGETVERIVVRKGDTAAALAEKFATDHNLTEDVKKKLEALIEGQMNTVLDNIEEEVEGEHKSNC